VGELLTVTSVGDGARPPTTAANASGPAGDRLTVGQAVAPVPHTAAIVPVMPRMVSSPLKVKPAFDGVYVALLAPIKGVDGNASGTAAGKPAKKTSDENVTPPPAAKVQLLNISSSPLVGTFTITLAVQFRFPNPATGRLTAALYVLVEPV
jgi:hypothetical protein